MFREEGSGRGRYRGNTEEVALCRDKTLTSGAGSGVCNPLEGVEEGSKSHKHRPAGERSKKIYVSV